MPLLPFDHFRIETSLSTDEVRNVLAANVETRKSFRVKETRCAFAGEVASDAFRLRRIIGYRNSFLPLIRGRIIATSGGCLVEGTMSLHPTVLGFLIVWCSLLLLFGRRMWIDMLAQGALQPPALLPVGMLAFAWTLTSVAFTVEARKARALLIKLLVPSGAATRNSSLVA